MTLKNAVRNRLIMLKSVALRSPTVRRVGFWDGVFCIMKYYGYTRKNFKKRFKVTSLGEGLDWIDGMGYGLAWPAASPLDKLASIMVELSASTNSHYYFTHSTRVKPDDVVVDVGACEGAFALECLIRYRASEVYCFEPSPLMTTALAITAERNSLAGRMHVVPAAVSNVTGSVEFIESLSDPLVSHAVNGPVRSPDPCGQMATIEVAQTTLDHWAEQQGIEKFDYLKIDAEGYDLAALEGARACLERWRPAIAVTTYHDAEHCEQILRFLKSLNLGYQFRIKGLVVHHSIPRPVMLHASLSG